MVGFASAAGAAAGQTTGTITGEVTDAAGAPVQGADITLLGTGLNVVSDGRGQFRFWGAPAGPRLVRARRLGFRPDTIPVHVAPGAESAVRFRLEIREQVLTPVVVRADRVKYVGRLAGFYERLEQRRGGYFITRHQIESEQPRTMSHLLTRVPGLSLSRGRGGITALRMRGRNCVPLVWLDGTPMPSGDVDLDSFSPQSFEGIELYLGGTTPPLRYSWIRDRSACGTVLLWTRETMSPGRGLAISRPVLEELLDSASVFTAAQVDTAARLEPAALWEVDYPASLFASGIAGNVIAELIVDARGRVEEGTIGIVSSTHPAFGEAVVVALDRAVFRPAVRNGKAVRQLVLQPVEFIPPPRPGQP
jgi:TonB family protein